MPLLPIFAPTFADAEREDMVRTVMQWIQIFKDNLAPTDPEWIVDKLRCLLRAGLADRQHIITSARAGDLLAHEALLREFRELTDNHLLPPASFRHKSGSFARSWRRLL